MTPEEFSKFANQPYTFVPLVREVLADLDTPLSTYLKLANAPYSYLFESVHGGEKWGRYSIIGLPCTTRIKVFGTKSMIEKDHESLSVIESDDPLTWIAEYQQQFKVAEVEGMPRFSGGLVGYFGYDTIRYIEPRLAGHENRDELNTPDILLVQGRTRTGLVASTGRDVPTSLSAFYEAHQQALAVASRTWRNWGANCVC